MSDRLFDELLELTMALAIHERDSRAIDACTRGLDGDQAAMLVRVGAETAGRVYQRSIFDLLMPHPETNPAIYGEVRTRQILVAAQVKLLEERYGDGSRPDAGRMIAE